MGAMATFLFGLIYIGLIEFTHDAQNNYMITANVLIAVILLVPMTIHQLEPETVAENMMWWSLGIFIPIIGLFLVPPVIESWSVQGLAGELLSYSGVFIQITVLFSIGAIAWNAISIWRSKKRNG